MKVVIIGATGRIGEAPLACRQGARRHRDPGPRGAQEEAQHSGGPRLRKAWRLARRYPGGRHADLHRGTSESAEVRGGHENQLPILRRRVRRATQNSSP